MVITHSEVAAAPSMDHQSLGNCRSIAVPPVQNRVPVSSVIHGVDIVVLQLSRIAPFRSNLDFHLIRIVMVFTFYIFGYQKWFSFEAHQISSFISHSPLVFWLIPAFGIQGAGYFLGTTEWLFGTLILLGFWDSRLGMLGALGSIVSFLGTVSIIPL